MRYPRETARSQLRDAFTSYDSPRLDEEQFVESMQLLIDLPEKSLRVRRTERVPARAAPAWLTGHSKGLCVRPAPHAKPRLRLPWRRTAD